MTAATTSRLGGRAGKAPSKANVHHTVEPFHWDLAARRARDTVHGGRDIGAGAGW